MNRRHLPVLTLLALAACAPKTEAPLVPQAARYVATDFAFAGPDTLAPGLITVTFVNGGSQPHHMMLAKLDSGKTMADFGAFMQANPTKVPDFVTWHGAAGILLPQDSTTTTIDLSTGSYLALCFLQDPADGKMHADKGMVRPIVVTGTPHSAPVPSADTDLHAKDFAFTFPDTMTAGMHTIHFINDGPQPHEAQLVRLNDGVTAEQFMAAAGNPTNPPPGTFLGGPGAYSQGLDAWWTVTLTPGNYLLLCFVPDPADGMPHAMKGMIKPFTVTGS
jgi:hypothetical protein